MAKKKSKAKKGKAKKGAAKAKKKVKAKKVRCAGTTNDGKRCKRMVTLPDKYCYLHKKKKKKR